MKALLMEGLRDPLLFRESRPVVLVDIDFDT
jgi:hypothetical protein